MTQTSRSSRAISSLADATGRTEEEVRLALAVTSIALVFMAALRLLNLVEDLDLHVFGYSAKTG